MPPKIDPQMLPRFILGAGPWLVLLAIYAFGGRTPASLQLVTSAIWLALALAGGMWLLSLDWKYMPWKLPWKDAKPREGNAPAGAAPSARRVDHRLSLITLTCWGGLIALQWWGFKNPSFYPAGPDLYDGIYPLQSHPLLPTTADAIRGSKFLLLLAGILCWTLLTAHFARDSKRAARSALIVFLGFSLLAAVGALARLSGTDKILWIFESHTSYFFGTFFYKNHWAEQAVLMTALGIGLARRFWRSERHAGHFPDRTVSFSSLVFVVALTIPLANARGGMLALSGVIMALIIRLFRRQKLTEKKQWGPALLTLCAALIGGGVFFVLSAPSLQKGIERTERQWLLYEQGESSKYPELRGYLWEDALRAFADRPLAGWGIGSYAHIQLIYAGEKLRSMGDGTSPPLVEFTHNDYLQCLVEFGLLGSFLLVLPPLVAAIQVLRGHRLGILGSWICIGLGAVLFTAAIDFPFGNPAITLSFCWLAGLAYANRQQRNAAV
jgi:O-antigen ligase